MKRIFSLLLAASFCLPVAAPAEACTIWGAAGKSAANGVTLLAKNRDAKPAVQEMKLYKNGGIAYYGFSDTGSTYLTAGFNAKGLAIVVAKPSVREKGTKLGKRVDSHQVLSKCATVDEVLKHSEYFQGPDYLIFADAHEIARVEVGTNGVKKVERCQNGTLAHSNHYLAAEFASLNDNANKGSMVRLERIEALLANSAAPFTADAFISFCNDQNANENQSLLRTGAGHPITTYSLVLSLPADGNISVWFQDCNADGSPKGEPRTFSYQELFGK